MLVAGRPRAARDPLGPEQHHAHPVAAHNERSIHPRTPPAPPPTPRGYYPRRISQLTDEIRELEQQITAAITSHTPTLLTRRGIAPGQRGGPAHRRRRQPPPPPQRGLLAPPCAASAPSRHPQAQPTRHRLNRGGDRQAGAALSRITLSRLRWDARTRDYLARRITEGTTHREAIRCLKRSIAREIYQIITSPPEAEPSAA